VSPNPTRGEGGGCYWEKLSAPTGKLGDIIANGGFEANQTLVIDSPSFSTSDCGEWVKIGSWLVRRWTGGFRVSASTRPRTGDVWLSDGTTAPEGLNGS
jgi:hypothetical protein